MTYTKINNLCGWLLALLAFILYACTMERTASFWDCGEFLACAYKVEVGHSPGAPLFMLLQRFFALFAGPHTWTAQPSATAAFAINMLSVLTSALTIMFLFWTITRLCSRVLVKSGAPGSTQTFLILSAGITGALAYTFSDTFWFSAVEAEVYATSSFFTALVFWAMLKWEAIADAPHADRWLLLIFYLIGLSIGIHLLNLLTIPAMAMVYYFRRYRSSYRGMILAFASGCLLLALVQFGIIQCLPILASGLELFMVNGMGLPFHSGALLCVLLCALVLVLVLRYARRKGKVLLHTLTLGLVFVCIGFSTYVIPILRSSADTPVDVNNPDNILALVPYVQREQYVHPPLLSGQDFDSRITGVQEGKSFYYADGEKGRYIESGKKADYTYEPGETRLFPRIWDNFDPSHQRFYRSYLDLAAGERPTTRDNLSFFFRYQMNWLWFRYFMWNYAGRQNDYEGQGEARNGNWISGISFIDHPRTGTVALMSDPYRNNPARNELYCLPLLLGIAGLCWHFRRQRKDAFIVLLLFFFTGIAIGLYLNMNPVQPRERDYAFAGCTYAFAIWIGMGVLLTEEGLRRLLPGAGKILALAACLLAVPVLMAVQEWDDHTRHDKSLAKATARNTLLSCAPNAILFTQGDNDTYPLWYLQEVEGVRTDVRVVITELLNADWYIDQLRYKVNDAGALPMIWSREDYMGDRNNYVSYVENPAIPKDRFFDLYEICRFIASGDRQHKLMSRAGKEVAYLPTQNLYLQLPADTLRGNGSVTDSNNRLYFSLKQEGVQKKELAVMNILAANARDGWKRPVYFNGSYPNRDNILNLAPYLRMEGIVYRLAPFAEADYNARLQQVNNIDTEKSLRHFLSLYRYGGAEKRQVYFDEKNRVMLMSYRLNSIELAERLSALGRKKEAVVLLDQMLRNITPEAYPHDEISFFMAEAYYHAGAPARGAQLSRLLAQYLQQDEAWIRDLGESRQPAAMSEWQRSAALLQRLAATARSCGDVPTADYLHRGADGAQPLHLPVPAP